MNLLLLCSPVFGFEGVFVVADVPKAVKLVGVIKTINESLSRAFGEVNEPNSINTVAGLRRLTSAFSAHTVW